MRACHLEFLTFNYQYFKCTNYILRLMLNNNNNKKNNGFDAAVSYMRIERRMSSVTVHTFTCSLIFCDDG